MSREAHVQFWGPLGETPGGYLTNSTGQVAPSSLTAFLRSARLLAVISCLGR